MPELVRDTSTQFSTWMPELVRDTSTQFSTWMPELVRDTSTQFSTWMPELVRDTSTQFSARMPELVRDTSTQFSARMPELVRDASIDKNTIMKRKLYHPPHVYLDNTTYFITARTFNRQPMFANPDYKSQFRNFLKTKLIKYEVKCSAWVILNEHYHLLIHIKNKPQLLRFIKSLHGESAIWLNKKDGSTGRRVWYNYWDYIPRSEREFYTIFNYIHANPAKHGYLKRDVSFLQNTMEVSLTQGEAVDFHDMLMNYPFSSYPYYAKKYGRHGILQAWLDYPLAPHGKDWD